MGSDGACSFSINVGGKVFRAHHDELQKGLIAGSGTMNSVNKAGESFSSFSK
jgi:hypothetical protein